MPAEERGPSSGCFTKELRRGDWPFGARLSQAQKTFLTGAKKGEEYESVNAGRKLRVRGG